MTRATGVGSWPGADAASYAEVVRRVLGELPDLPHLPEMPGRGPRAGMIGRALAVVAELGADLQPAGWRLTDAPGVDHRRARSLLGQDLDVFEEHAQGVTAPVKVQVAGPWTLAAGVERPRGDKVLADHGARRELAQALAEGLRRHVAEVRRRLPGAAELVVQLDEPALPAVLAGRVPTASGFSRHRSVDAPMADQALRWVLDAVREAGGVPVVHCCDHDVPVELIRGAGAAGISVDLTRLGAAAHDGLAAAVDAGERVLLGVVPATPPEGTGAAAEGPDAGAAIERVRRWLDMVGLAPGPTLAITPTCGLAGAPPGWARRATAVTRGVAADLG